MAKLGLPSEHDEQKILGQWLDLMNLAWFAVPNSARRNYKTAAWLKAEGLKAGVPDIIIATMAPANGKPTAIELKATKGGRISDAQKAWLAVLANSGWNAFVAFGCEQALAQLRELGY